SWHLTQHCPITAVLPAGSPCGRDLRLAAPGPVSLATPSSPPARNVASDATPRLCAAVMNPCPTVWGGTFLVIPAGRAPLRPTHPAPCRSSRGLSDDKATTVKPPCLLRHVIMRDSAEPSAAPGNVPCRIWTAAISIGHTRDAVQISRLRRRLGRCHTHREGSPSVIAS